MPVLHYRVHILEITDPEARLLLKQSRRIQRAVLKELDETHWLIDGRYISNIEKVCSKAGIPVTVALHG
jgi:hypothetical protein